MDVVAEESRKAQMLPTAVALYTVACKVKPINGFVGMCVGRPINRIGLWPRGTLLVSSTQVQQHFNILKAAGQKCPTLQLLHIIGYTTVIKRKCKIRLQYSI